MYASSGVATPSSAIRFAACASRANRDNSAAATCSRECPTMSSYATMISCARTVSGLSSTAARAYDRALSASVCTSVPSRSKIAAIRRDTMEGKAGALSRPLERAWIAPSALQNELRREWIARVRMRSSRSYERRSRSRVSRHCGLEHRRIIGGGGHRHEHRELNEKRLACLLYTSP